MVSPQNEIVSASAAEISVELCSCSNHRNMWTWPPTIQAFWDSLFTIMICHLLKHYFHNQDLKMNENILFKTNCVVWFVLQWFSVYFLVWHSSSLKVYNFIRGTTCRKCEISIFDIIRHSNNYIFWLKDGHTKPII